MLEKLIKYLADNGIEVPEGTDKAGVLAIIEALLDASDSEANDGEDKKEDKKEEAVTKTAEGVA